MPDMFPFTFPPQSSNRKYSKCLPTFFFSWFFCCSQNYLISFCQNRYLFYSAYYFLTKLHLIFRIFKDPLIFLLLSVCPPFCPFALTLFKSNMYSTWCTSVSSYSKNRTVIAEFKNLVFANNFKRYSRVSKL